MAFFRCIVFATGLVCLGCASYKSDIMFSPTTGDNLLKTFPEPEATFTIHKNDQLEIDVYSNAGETKPAFPAVGAAANTSTGDENTSAGRATFMVDERGVVKFPVIQEVKLEGLSLREAEALLQNEYSKFITAPFVKLTLANKRVVVLGATGGKVIPLRNEQMKLTEVLALAEGIPEHGNASNVRVLRNNDVIIANLSTIDGYREGNIVIQPNDIIYVEPVKRPFSQGLRDYGPVLSIITSIAALIVVLVGVN